MTGRVLIVDDLVPNVKLLEAKLRSEYYATFTAMNGVECLEKVKRVNPDIILLDVMMPEMDGFECCRRLKADPETAFIPIVMVTALSETKDRIQGLEAGATDFITKPINELHLFARVRSLIRTKFLVDELRMRDKTGAQFGLTTNMILTSVETIAGNALVIDDDVVQGKKIAEILSEAGHNCVSMTSSNVEEISNYQNVDLLIINAMLDNDDGIALGMQLKSIEHFRHVPILMMIDEDEQELLVKALDVGIDDYILTPLEMNELLARTKNQIQRKKYQDSLREQHEKGLNASIVDALTGLHNRRYLDAHLHNMIEESLRKQRPLSVMMVDIDHFKQVNDKPGWGHDIGDEVLKALSTIIKDTVRAQNLVARMGGEEFIVVMPRASLEVAEMVAERVRNQIQMHDFKISAEPGSLKATVSIGVSTLALDGDNITAIIKRADECLYAAKNAGRNRVISTADVADAIQVKIEGDF